MVIWTLYDYCLFRGKITKLIHDYMMLLRIKKQLKLLFKESVSNKWDMPTRKVKFTVLKHLKCRVKVLG